MTVNYIGKHLLDDNELSMFNELFEVVKHADCCPDIVVDRKPEKVMVRIKPSDIGFKPQIVRNLLHINKQGKPYRVRFSSSLAISPSVSFEISTEKLANLNS